VSSYGRLLARLDGLRTLGVEFGLERIVRALQMLGAPERRLPAIQIAGTNGKGSTAAMTEAILRAAGLRTGLFTSPHLSRFTERIRIDGIEADGDRLAALDRAVEATGVPLTYFEVSTVLGFLLMAEAGVEIAVLETGLGGRLDAVTACHPLATAVTSIAFDHMDYLGTTLAAIAREKAGIIKPGVPVLIGRLPAEAEAEIERVARERGAPLRRLGRDFHEPAGAPALGGAHQRGNAAIAIALAEEACRRLGRPLPPETVRQGLASVRWPGRLERIAPDLLLDCAHNPEGAAALAAALAAAGAPVASGPRALVLSVVGDKDVDGVLAPLLAAPASAGGFGAVYATRSHNRRARPPAELVEAIARHTTRTPRTVTAVADPLDAVAQARRLVASQDLPGLVVVAGSIFLIGEVRAAMLSEATDPVPVADPL